MYLSPGSSVTGLVDDAEVLEVIKRSDWFILQACKPISRTGLNCKILRVRARLPISKTVI